MVDRHSTAEDSDAGIVGPGTAVSIRIGLDRARQIDLLARSTGVTVVGVANEWIADTLEEALRSKRQTEDNADSFWEYLHIIFLSEHLLEHIWDQYDVESPSAQDALERRIRRAGQVKRRLMSFLLRHGSVGQWALYTYPRFLPLTGSIFDLPGEGRVVQLLLPPGTKAQEAGLVLEFAEPFVHSFQPTFQQIRESSREEHEVVLVGAPTSAGEFACRGARFRRALLREGHNASDWLPATVALTWRRGVRGPEPLLQVNTPNNSTREMGKASHVSGYINLIDQAAFDLERSSEDSHDGTSSILDIGAVRGAIRRELRTDFGIVQTPSQAEFVDTIPFYYTDKENLFFYLMSQEIAPDQIFDASCQMFSWTVAELESARRRQVALNALAAFQCALLPPQRKRIGELLHLNFRAQGDPEMAYTVLEALSLGNPSATLVTRLEVEAESNQVYKYVGGRTLSVDGLAGLQYRVFYSHLLPAYAQIGIPGAADTLASLRDEPDRDIAIRTLNTHYSTEDYICSLPIEV